MENITKKIRPTLLGMAIGEIITFPIEKLKSVRVQASELGAMFDMGFKKLFKIRIEKML
ncbi:hypothetical protein [Bacteroides acidifaciens]|uniref:hypothetical protein n=1 Tax=Bacteroides acidifaciens TaxID=85831 RepID=UPI0025AE9141|nr:hypothetical protein [Bacteroides acidifaciens]